MTTTDIRRTQLQARRAELVARSKLLEKELTSHDTKDWDDAATEAEQDEVLEHIGLSAAEEIRRIDAALARIDAGAYGICAKCGDTISPDRLDLVPYTPFCRVCAR
jgi:RNA polymerase-binding transcription factor DksA